MLISNYKNLVDQLHDLKLNELINSCNKTPCEENLLVLRNLCKSRNYSNI